jgi:hypothetical protein
VEDILAKAFDGKENAVKKAQIAAHYLRDTAGIETLADFVRLLKRNSQLLDEFMHDVKWTSAKFVLLEATGMHLNSLIIFAIRSL